MTLPNVAAFLPQNPASIGSTMPQMMQTQMLTFPKTSPSASFRTICHSTSSDEEIGVSSADVDSDEEAEQRLGDEFDDANGVNGGEFALGDGADRWNGLLASTGLKGKLRHVTDLPDERTVSTFDIFCNRELKMQNLAAIGFDMDYTLARYQQPAFDKLAFDGAKEKLVTKLK